MTDNGPLGPTPTDEDPASSSTPLQPPASPTFPVEDPEVPPPASDPGYLTRTGEAVGDDGSVVPIIGGLPVVEGSAWDIGAPADERGVDFDEEGNPATED